MGHTVFHNGVVRGAPGSSKSMPGAGFHRSVQREPTDAYYYANVDVVNMVVGSKWMLGYDDGGAFVELDSGTAATADFTISNVPAYSGLFLMELRVRHASGATRYKPGNFFIYHNAAGVTVFVSQVLSKVS